MWRLGDIPFELLGIVFRAIQRREDKRVAAEQKAIRDITSGHWMKED